MQTATNSFAAPATRGNTTPDALVAHRRYLHRFALSRLREPDIAEELVQDTLVAALEGYARFRGASALRTWLAGILNHKISDWYRREARSPLRDAHAVHGEAGIDGDELADPQFDAAGDWITPSSAWPDPEKALENHRFWETFDSCLCDLPPASARAFYMREIQGMSTEEICNALKISKSNCWVMLHRARLCLRSQLEARWFGDRPAAMGAAA